MKVAYKIKHLPYLHFHFVNKDAVFFVAVSLFPLSMKLFPSKFTLENFRFTIQENGNIVPMAISVKKQHNHIDRVLFYSIILYHFVIKQCFFFFFVARA